MVYDKPRNITAPYCQLRGVLFDVVKLGNKAAREDWHEE